MSKMLPFYEERRLRRHVSLELDGDFELTLGVDCLRIS